MTIKPNIFSRVKAAITALQNPNTVSNNQDVSVLTGYYPRWLNFYKDIDIQTTYNKIGVVSYIANNLSVYFSNGIWKFKTDDGDILTEHPAIDKMKSPNPLQLGMEMHKQSYLYYNLFGNGYQFLNVPIGFEDREFNLELVKTIVNLPSQHIKVIPTGQYLRQTDIKGIIDYYRFEVNGYRYDIDPRCIIHRNDLNINFEDGQYTGGLSRLFANNKSISNIDIAYTALNILHQARGGTGILTREAGSAFSESAGNNPIEPDDAEKYERKLNGFGLQDGKKQIHVVKDAMKWQPMIFPTKDLMLFESLNNDEKQVARALGYPEGLLLDKTPFANRNNDLRRLYQDKIIPDANDYADRYNIMLNIQGGKLFLDYSHIQILQADKKIEAEKDRINVDIIETLNKGIKEGTQTPETALSILVNVVGMPEQTAGKVLIESPTNEND